MVLDIGKILGINGASGSAPALKMGKSVQRASTNSYGIMCSPDPFNQGELSPKGNYKFDSNAWIQNFAK